MVKNPPDKQQMWVRSLGQEGPLEKEMATHSGILAWEIHGQRSLAGSSLCSPKRVQQDLATKPPSPVTHSQLLKFSLKSIFLQESGRKNRNNLLHVETLSGSMKGSSALILLYWSFYPNVWLLGKIQWLPQCPTQGRHFMHKCKCHAIVNRGCFILSWLYE